MISFETLQRILAEELEDRVVANLVAKDVIFLNALDSTYNFKEWDLLDLKFGEILYSFTFNLESMEAHCKDHFAYCVEDCSERYDFMIASYTKLRLRARGSRFITFSSDFQNLKFGNATYEQEQT